MTLSRGEFSEEAKRAEARAGDCTLLIRDLHREVIAVVSFYEHMSRPWHWATERGVRGSAKSFARAESDAQRAARNGR